MMKREANQRRRPFCKRKRSRRSALPAHSKSSRRTNDLPPIVPFAVARWLRPFARLSLAIAFTLLLTASLLAAKATAPSTPKRGGTLRTARPTDWRSLDPAIAFDTAALPFQRLLFRGLLDYDDGVNLVPDQARDWSLSDDQRTYTFHLRTGIRFAHGREVEAEDYVFSLERVLDSETGSPGQTYFSENLGAKEFQEGKVPHVRGLRAPARDTLVIELEKPEFTFRYKLAMPFAYALPREVVHRGRRELGRGLVL